VSKIGAVKSFNYGTALDQKKSRSPVKRTKVPDVVNRLHEDRPRRESPLKDAKGTILCEYHGRGKVHFPPRTSESV